MNANTRKLLSTRAQTKVARPSGVNADAFFGEEKTNVSGPAESAPASVTKLTPPVAKPTGMVVQPRESIVDPLAVLAAQLKAMELENAKLRAANVSGASMTVKVSEKGAVSVYGLGRFPVTLYGEQWTKLLGMGESIASFIKANENHPAVAAARKARADAKAARLSGAAKV